MSKFNFLTDYTSLTTKETIKDIVELCIKANKIGVKSVCIYPQWVNTAKVALSALKSNVLVCTVISFPEGNKSTKEKLEECQKAIDDGADEIDMVANYQLVKENWDSKLEKVDENISQLILTDILKMVSLCHNNNKILKVIVESGVLTLEQTKYFTEICYKANADFIKTSTGKVSVGAEIEKVKIMRNTINDLCGNMNIKASGGIRTLEDQDKFWYYVDRFGMDFGSVDKINNIDETVNEEY